MELLFGQIKSLFDIDDYEVAIALLEEAIEENLDNTELYWHLGLAYLLQGNEAQAQKIWLSVLLRQDEEEVVAITQQLLNFLEGQVEETINAQKLGNAKIIYEAIIALEPDYINEPLAEGLVAALYEFGNYLRTEKDYTTALDVYKELLSICSDHTNSWRAIANCHINLENYDQAEDFILKSIELSEIDLVADFQLLGIILEKKEQYKLAIAAFERVISIDPKFLDAYAILGSIYLKSNLPEKAIEVYKKTIGIASDGYVASIYEKIAEAYSLLKNQSLQSLYLGLSKYINGEYKNAIIYFEEYLVAHPNSINIILKIANAYACLNEYDVAIKKLEAVSKLFPELTSLDVVSQAILPLVYRNQDELLLYRQRYEKSLDDLLTKVNTYHEGQFYSAFNALPMRTTYHLGYQGLNDARLNHKYSQYIYQITKAIFPSNFYNKKINKENGKFKIRVGYISTHFDRLGKLYINWMKYRNYEKYEIYIYDISGNDHTVNYKNKRLAFRESLSSYVDNFKYITGKVENMSGQILVDNLDILIFPDIGLSPKVQVLSAMRLAPIQCSAWGHPITSGSPNIDYFLSSELMEPNNADEHYTETLIKLPNLGFSIIEPAIPKLTKHRSDFQIPENSIIYLCCQSIFKYLPIFDDVFPKIVQRNPQAYFVLIDTHPTTGIIKYLKERLRIAFRRYELNYEEWFIFIPALSFEEYLMVLQLSDIFLDTFAWSGGISSIDAITCGLPIVTYPGEMMRSRQSYGMLNMIGVTETIAKNETDYIEIAVRLGQDSQWRQSVVDKIWANKYKLFNDKSCIVALELFFEQAIAKKIKEDDINGNE